MIENMFEPEGEMIESGDEEDCFEPIGLYEMKPAREVTSNNGKN